MHKQLRDIKLVAAALAASTILAVVLYYCAIWHTDAVEDHQLIVEAVRQGYIIRNQNGALRVVPACALERQDR